MKQSTSLRTTTLLLSLLVTMTSLFVLAGWALDIATLKSVLPGLVTMKANTALGMFLCGTSLALLSRESIGKFTRYWVVLTPVVIILIATLSLCEDIFQLNLKTDQLLFSDSIHTVESSNPGRMSPSIAFCFLCVGFALLAIQSTRLHLRKPCIAALGTTVIIIGGVAFFGHISNMLFNIRFWDYAGMAPHTTVAFILLGVALLTQLQSEEGLSWSLNATMTSGFVIGAVSLLAAGAGSYYFTNQLKQNANLLALTQDTLREIGDIISIMELLESNQRGYIITGDKKLLENRLQDKSNVQINLNELSDLTVNDSKQQKHIAKLKILIAKRLDWGDRAITIREQQGFPNAQKMIITGTGIVLTNEIHHVLAEMQNEGHILLKEHEKQENIIATKTFLLLPLGVFLSLAMLSLGLFTLNTDINERKKIEKALTNNKAQLQAIFDNMTEAIIVLDLNHNIIKINPACINLYDVLNPHMSPEAMIATYDLMLPTGEILPPEKWPSYRAFRGEYVHNYELCVRNKDTGKLVYVEFNTAPLRNSIGEVTQVIISFRDMTERKHIEASRLQLAVIVESTNDAIISKDLNGIITSWNAAAEKIFGYSANEIIGRSISCLIPPERQQEELRILETIKRGEKIMHLETVRKRKDGQLIYVSATISPIRNIENNIIGASKIVRDITEKRQLEQQLRQSQKMEAIGQLTGGVAHDFNNLLGVILGNLDLLERLVAGNEEAIKRIKTSLKAATRGADLTKRLLAFSRLQQLHPAPTSLEESIKNTVEMARRTLGPEIKITTQLDKSISPVLVDAAGLESVLLNLAVNGRDAMPNGGSLTISTQLKKLEKSYPPVQTGEIKPGTYACISVSDTGHGMSRETMERAFEPFFTTKPRDKGTGLGLSMVYGFIKQSGGIIKIYSELEHGTTVSFYLPLAEGSIITPTSHVVEMEQQPKVSGTVLVVDDEVDLLEIAVIYLKEMGYDVFSATDAKSALAIVEHEPNIDLLITDVIMPGRMNGVELAKKIRQQKQNIVVVYLSGFPSKTLAERGGTKIDGPLINKPYQREEFVTTIRRVVTMNNHHAK